MSCSSVSWTHPRPRLSVGSLSWSMGRQCSRFVLLSSSIARRSPPSINSRRSLDVQEFARPALFLCKMNSRLKLKLQARPQPLQGLKERHSGKAFVNRWRELPHQLAHLPFLPIRVRVSLVPVELGLFPFRLPPRHFVEAF